MRRPPGLRAGWAPTQPAEGQVSLPGATALRPPATAVAAAAPAWPPVARPAGPGAASASTGAAAVAPRPGVQPATRPGTGGPAVAPVAGFRATRPAPEFQPTRPAADFQPTRPVSDFLHTRPLADFQPTRPWADGATATATPVRRAAAPAPVAPHISAPKAEGHWQVAGTPGENLVLMPGQMHVGQHVGSVRTLLGSCVAITLWHPTRRIGGMCHFLLPQRQRRNGEPPDGRYGDEAVEAMVKALLSYKTQPAEYVAHLYGGADTMSGVSAARFNIGERNIEQGWSLIDKYGFQLDGVDVGEDIPRMVAMTLATGIVTMRRGTGSAPDHLRG